MVKKNSLSRNLEVLPKHREFAKVVNSLILKVKDISVFATKISKFCLKLNESAKSVLYM